MVWSDTITFQLLTRATYATFSPKPIADAHTTSAALFAISCDGLQDVDAIVEAAVSAGGKGDIRDRQDHGFMYGRTFEDPDGNIFEPIWMDPAGMAAEPAIQGS
ncbi:conserved hypothetical protein [Bradyrhizobium sp. STM 3843]|nr:conserved hypothetical protein [Bradyrhizobium sp. STM 3843]